MKKDGQLCNPREPWGDQGKSPKTMLPKVTVATQTLLTKKLFKLSLKANQSSQTNLEKVGLPLSRDPWKWTSKNEH